jgi:tetratricopeptide (TPR) repeat protein
LTNIRCRRFEGIDVNADTALALERGTVARREKRLDDARAAFAEAADSARKSGVLSDLAAALTNQAQIERDTGFLDKALAYQLDALAIARGLNEPQNLAHVLRHVGDILQAANRHADADSYYREMLALYRATPDTPPLDIANAVRSVALHAQNLGQKDEARRLWREARDRYATLDALFLSLTGSAENPGVKEADRRLAALDA